MIELNLKKHCIETEIRKQYNLAVKGLLKKDAAGVEHLEYRIKLLKHALETLDFGNIRSIRKEFSGHTDSDISISADPEDKLQIFLDGKIVDYS